jgi:hypothetical protein
VTDSEQVKAALAALAEGEAAEDGKTTASDGEGGPRADYRRVIERAVTAIDDIEAAAEFVDAVGLDRLEAAVATAEREVSGLAEDGREALATFERFRVAAAGPREE